MSKPYGHTAAGQITHFLRGQKRPVPFTAAELAHRFNTSTRNVNGILRNLKANNWTITSERHKLNRQQIYYTATPPGANHAKPT